MNWFPGFSSKNSRSASCSPWEREDIGPNGGVVHYKVDVVIVRSSQRKGSALSFTEVVMVVLRDLWLEICISGG